jgi:nicastrin
MFAFADNTDSTSSRLSSLLITPFSSAAPCVALTTARAGREGCGSRTLAGEVGVLLPVDGAASLAIFLGLGSAGGPADPSATAGVRTLFVAAVAPSMLSNATLSALAALPWTAGALALEAPLGAAEFFSEGAVLQPPRGGAGARAWNPAGRGLVGLALPFPVAALRGGDSARARAAAAENAAALARGALFSPAPWAAHMRFFFGPGGLATGACLAAGSCSPLGGFSAWGWLSQGAAAAGGWNASAPPGASAAAAAARLRAPGVLAVAALDAAALFHDLAWGADGAASGLAALLLAAEALGRTANASALPRPILFAAFQGEAWGRVGSRRWAAEALNASGFACAAPVAGNASASGRPFCGAPLRADLTFTSLRNATPAVVVAADQVGGNGGGGGGGGVWLRGAGGAGGARAVAVAAAVAAAGAPACAAPPYSAPLPPSALPATDAALPLPPSPLRTFSPIAPALLLSGYDGAFSNPAWASRWDNATGAPAVASAATLLARTLWALANDTGGGAPADVAAGVPARLCANATLAGALLGCLTVDAGPSCGIFTALYGPGALPPGPLSLYASIYTPGALLPGPPAGFSVAPKPVEALARTLLSLWGAGVALDGSVAAAAAGAPASAPNCSACPGGTEGECTLGWCVPPAAWWHDALSPALAVDAGSGAISLDERAAEAFGLAEDPVYAEPLWGTLAASLLRVDSPGVAVGVFCAGALLTLATAAALAWPVGAQGSSWALRALDKEFRVP